MPRLRVFAAVALVALLTACATEPPRSSLPPVPHGDEFELAGRVAVKLDGRGHSARIRWLHRLDSDAVWLYSPVGSTIATLQADDTMATLVTSRQETFQSDSVQQLTRDVLGWALPLDGLRFWVLGRVDPQMIVEDIEHDERMRIVRLVQGGWQIEFTRYQDNASLPAAMVLRFADLRMRLLIDRWHHASLVQ